MTDDASRHEGDDDAGRDEDELGAAVDDAMADEIRRQRARFIQQIVGSDRGEGTGRSEAYRNDSTYRDLPADRRDEPADRRDDSES